MLLIMSEIYHVVIIEFPDDRKISVLKAVRSLTNLSLNDAKNLIESSPPISILNTSSIKDAEKAKLDLVNAGAIAMIENNPDEFFKPFVASHDLLFLDAMQNIKERILLLRQEQVKTKDTLVQIENSISEINQEFQQLYPELEKLGQTLFDNQEDYHFNDPKIIKIKNEISVIRLKLLEAEEARSKRKEEAEKGFWNKIKSSLGNLLDNVETYQKNLSDTYVDLTKAIVISDANLEQLNSVTSDDLLNKVKVNLQKQSSHEQLNRETVLSQSQANLELNSLANIAENNLAFCRDLDEFYLSMGGFDEQFRKNLENQARKIVPNPYPSAKNYLGGEVGLIDDYVVISKGTFFKVQNFFDDDANVVKIPVESITVVNFKESGIKDGFLEFVYPGYFPKPKQNKHSQENVITFRGKEENKKFSDFKEIVETRMREFKQRQNSAVNLSEADELSKFAKLHQEGVITDEEFRAKKAKILGL